MGEKKHLTITFWPVNMVVFLIELKHTNFHRNTYVSTNELPCLLFSSGNANLLRHGIESHCSYLFLFCFVFFQTPAAGKDKPQAGPSKAPSVAEIRNKLMAAAKEVRPLPSFTGSLTPGLNPVIQHPPLLTFLCSFSPNQGKPLPKTEQKFENFVKSAFKISDKKVSLWHLVWIHQCS